MCERERERERSKYAERERAREVNSRNSRFGMDSRDLTFFLTDFAENDGLRGSDNFLYLSLLVFPST